MDLSWLPAVLLSAGTLVGGAIYAAKKGIPDLQERADIAARRLVEALEGQLALANAELATLRPRLSAADVRITALETEVERLEKRIVRLTLRLLTLEGKDGNGV